MRPEEAARALRPGGHLLVGFQAGEGSHDVSTAYARHGRDVELARLVRRPRGSEKDDQAVLLASRD